MVIAGRERNHPVEMLALHPELILARRVARIVAALEHRDHDDLDWNRRNLGDKRPTEEGDDNRNAEGHPHESSTA